MQSLRHRVAGGLFVLTGSLMGGSSYYIDKEFGPETIPRMSTLYRVAIPGLLAYKKVQLLDDEWRRSLGLSVDEDELNRSYEKLHAEWAPRAFAVVLELRGFNLKTGQLVASNFADAFPREWQKIFEPLLDNVPPRDFATVKETVEREMGKSMDQVFSSFSTESLASASIGQVHRAVLRENGAHVVVKVMYPDVEGRFRGDLLAAKRFVGLAMPEHLEALREIEKQFANEFDYRREAAQLDLVRNNLARAPAFKHIIVPKPYIHLCSKMVLVMEEVPNCEKLTSALEADMRFFAQRRGVSIDTFIQEERAKDEEALKNGHMRCGPTAIEMEGHISKIRWSNWLGSFLGMKPSHVPLNHAQLVDELLSVHGHEVLIDGAFNGDPHPGNVLVSRLTPTSQPRLALVDYGQVKILPQHQRLALARLIIALADAPQPPRRTDEIKIMSLMEAMGWKSEKSDASVIFANARLFFDRDDALITGGKNTQAYLESLEARDRRIATGDDFVLVCRCSLMLRGLGHMLNQHRSTAESWRHHAEKVIHDSKVEELR